MNLYLRDCDGDHQAPFALDQSSNLLAGYGRRIGMSPPGPSGGRDEDTKVERRRNANDRAYGYALNCIIPVVSLWGQARVSNTAQARKQADFQTYALSTSPCGLTLSHKHQRVIWPKRGPYDIMNA